MATSGSKSVTVTSWDTLKFSWSESSQSITNNTTTISWKLQLIATSSGKISSTASKDWSVTVNGKKYSGTNTVGISANTTKTLASGSTTISHNSDGTKTFSYSFSQEFGITFSGSSIGTKSGSGSGTLDTIPRKSTLSVGNGTLNTEQTLTVTKHSSSFTHTIVATCGSASSTICTKSSSTSIKFKPPLSWASQNTSGTSVSVKYTITTYNGSSSLGSNSYTKTCSIPSSVKPLCTVAVTDSMGYANTYGGYIQGVSKFKVVVTPTLAYGSAIASYSTTANGSTYTSASFTTGVLASSGTLKVNATVKDKRGRTGSAGLSLVVLAYSAPKVSKLTVGRCDEDGTANDKGEYVKVTFSGSVTSLNNKNSAKYTVSFKKSTETSYTPITASNCVNSFVDYTGKYSVSNGSYIFKADTGSSYDVQLVVKDNFKTTPKNTSASTAFTLMHFSKGGTGMGIGKIAEEENLLDIGIPVRFNEGVVQKVLWSDAYYMQASQTITLSEPISKQANGIVLIFSEYSEGTAQNWSFSEHFIPKTSVSKHSGVGRSFFMTNAPLTYAATKYLYIKDTEIVGHENNTKTGTSTCGITYTNNRFVLRYVIGV